MKQDVNRIAISLLALSAAGFVAIVEREGYSDTAIIPVPGDVPTLGFGTTEGVRMGDRTTPVQAAVRALRDAQRYEGAVKLCVRVPLYQVEYDAYLLFSYNIGPTAFCNSTLVKKLNAGDYASACDQVLEWKMYQGIDCSRPNKVCAGLWKDRLKTHAACQAVQA